MSDILPKRVSIVVAVPFDLHECTIAVADDCGANAALVYVAGRGGLVVGRRTAVREDPGSNLTVAGRVYHDSHCDIQPWARVVHPYCSA